MEKYQRKPHAVLELASRRLKAVKIERLLKLNERQAPIRMLEIGTGSGGIAHYFSSNSERNYEVTSVDVIDQRAIRGEYHFHLVEDIFLPFPNNYFEVVITNHVIEHVGNKNKQLGHLKELRRVLKTNGIGYLATPNRWMIVEPHFHLAFLSWLPRSMRSTYLQLLQRGEYYDCEPLSLTELESLLNKAGFEYENICLDALHETLRIEGKKGFIEMLAFKMPDRILKQLLYLIPTLIYRFECNL